MQAILLNALLCLVIVWLLLIIYYTYCYIQFSHREDSREAKTRSDKAEGKAHEVHTLVGKSKGFVSRDFPNNPTIPQADVGIDKANIFASLDKEEVFDLAIKLSYDVSTISEEENEMQVAFTTDEVDEDEVAKEEMLLTRDPMPEVSPSAILARDLVRMGRWSKNDEELDEEDETEVQDTLSKVQGTDLMEKYKEHLLAESAKHNKFLAFVRKAEEEQNQAEALDDEETQPVSTSDAHPLDYYL